MERLRSLAVAPLALAAAGRRVLVGPDGPLCHVPFSLLLPGCELVHVPSGTVHGILVAQATLRGERVLAVGDPDYEAEGGGGALPQLPATTEEVTTIGDVVLLRHEATEAGFRGAVGSRARWRAIHLACHALVDEARPYLSALALTPTESEDGLLTTTDLYGVPLSADLVALSACSTGTGRLLGGEGILGLTRAVMFAGAPRVLCSLWKVDDDATKALMVRFYELWNPKGGSRGMGTAAALKAAQEHVCNHPEHPRWKHPYYWAAWVLWGLPD